MASPTTQVSGEIVDMFTKTVGANAVPITTVVLDEGGKYPSPIPVEFYGTDQSEWAEGLAVGASLNVDCYVNGRAWKNPRTGDMQYFVSLRATKQKVDESDRDQRPASEQPASGPGPVDDGGEMPF